jgi:hypothetical protein
MAYATVSHVQAFSTLEYQANTEPTKDQVAEFCRQTGAQIDSVLSARRYLTPVASASAPQSFPLLTYVNAMGAYALAEESTVDGHRAERARANWEAGLKWLATARLPDAAVDATRAALQIGVPSGAAL